MGLGQHAGFIIGSYAAVAIVVAALIGWLMVDGRRQQRMLDELDARGIKRRSSSTDSS